MEPQRNSGSDQQNKLRDNQIKMFPLVANSILTNQVVPSTVTPEIQQTVNECVRRSNSCIETKYKCIVSSERLAQLRKTVDTAIREHKIFTVRGGWNTLRKAFLHRNWIEKYENSSKKPATAPPLNPNPEDLVSNLPVKQEWESQTAYIEKCEKTIMSRLLQTHEVDFYWNMRKDAADWHHRLSSNKIMNRFSRSLYTSKEGLALLLQQMYWHNEPGVAGVNFPRCYVLGFPDHYNNFVDDFRLTACMGLLKWFTTMYEKDDHYAIKSPEGRIPFSALQFAIDRCSQYIACQKHLDIDRDFTKIWDHEWDQFLSHFYAIVHQNALFLESKEWSLSIMNAAAKTILKDMNNYWPDINIDGMKNIWILKPGNKCRGRGIQLIKHVEDVVKIMNLKLKYVVQKYIERPLIIYKTKFDIRQWFVVSSVQPLIIWMYKECYLRFSSQIFSLENFHESLHLTNHAVQCKYANVNQRDKALPDENMWDCYTFQTYLKQIGHSNKWNEVIFPGMREGIIAAMLASQDTMDRRPNTFELYGADFMLGDDFRPWLLEINSSPDLSYSTSVTARMCPQVLEDLVKVLIDKRRDPKADTGKFDLIYKQTLPRAPAYLGMSLSVRGRKIFKNRIKIGKFKEKENPVIKCRDRDIVKAEHIKSNIVLKNMPKLLSQDIYKGPVIGDLIEEIQHSFYHCNETGVDFVPAIQSEDGNKKKTTRTKSANRVSKNQNITTDKINKSNSIFRKQNVNENSNSKNNKKTIESERSSCKTKLNSCTQEAFNEWQMKYKLYNEKNLLVKNNLLWEKETASILNSKNISTKLCAQVSNDIRVNKNLIKNSNYSMSSINNYYMLPKLGDSYQNRKTQLSKELVTIGMGFKNCKSAFKSNNNILPAAVQNF